MKRYNVRTRVYYDPNKVELNFDKSKFAESYNITSTNKGGIIQSVNRSWTNKRTTNYIEPVINENTGELEAVISDLKMPGESGLEVLRYLNNEKINIPLIFLTGFGTLESCQESVKEGAFDYILKPIDNKDKVLFPLSHAVEKHRLEIKAREMQRDIIEMAEEHQKILEKLLSDVEMKERVQDKIGEILNKWED